MEADTSMLVSEHQIKDPFLSIIARDQGLVGSLVRAYPGSDNVELNLSWLHDWFRAHVEAWIQDKSWYDHQPKVSDEILEELSQPEERQTRPVKLTTVEPHYFRGFRKFNQAVQFSDGLIVIDGKNTSGKTSLAEALEWLFTGELQRRELGQGNPEELEGCISNQLKPDEEKTWVEASFVDEEGRAFTLRRELTEDYGVKSTAKCKSELYFNGELLADEEEGELLDELFDGLPPLLMQHTLRKFVHSTPSARRKYFEKLLRLDELTELIRIAVIGKAGLSEFPSATGSTSLIPWESIKASAEASSVKVLRRLEKSSTPETIRQGLKKVALEEFPQIITEEMTLPNARHIIEAKQEEVRTAKYPLLEQLKPKKSFDDSASETLRLEKLKTVYATYLEKLANRSAAKKACDQLDEALTILASSVKELADKGLVDIEILKQDCPLCEGSETLSHERVEAILGVSPLKETLTKAEKDAAEATGNFIDEIKKLVTLTTGLIPPLLSDTTWETANAETSITIAKQAGVAKKEWNRVHEELGDFTSALTSIEEALEGEIDADGLATLDDNISTILHKASKVERGAQEIAEAYENLKSIVGVNVSANEDYAFRGSWLTLVKDVEMVANDLLWERGKIAIQKVLEGVRRELMGVRQTILEGRRLSFSEGIEEIWKHLRTDRYSAYSKLHIPEPKGKGFPVEIQVKAMLDGGQEPKEVDALKVFSESQVNVLGIAAYITRARLLGHSLIIFDDPVQSMDENHFLTFSERLLPHLLDNGLQVVILTHNDMFARDMGDYHYDRDEYVTMSIRHSRREGCKIEEGNRRVSERLKRAEDLAEDGKLDEAWVALRYAIERLYLVTYKKYGPPKFKPRSWRGISAEDMWEKGVGEIIQEKAPGSSSELRAILKRTAGGAHDKYARGDTDVMNACTFLRSILVKLRVGG